MDKKIIKFDNIEIGEYKFYQNKSPISISYIDINKIVVSNKLPFGKQDFEYFIGYKYSEKIKALCTFCLHMIMYEKNFVENRRIYFLIQEEKVFIKYMEILEKVSNIIKNIFNSEISCSKKYLKAEKKIIAKG